MATSTVCRVIEGGPWVDPLTHVSGYLIKTESSEGPLAFFTQDITTLRHLPKGREFLFDPQTKKTVIDGLELASFSKFSVSLD